jgi:cell wall-associated NlpC family hydrolase
MSTGSRLTARAFLLSLVVGGLSVACATTGAVPLPFPSVPSVPAPAPTWPLPQPIPVDPSIAPAALPAADAIVQLALGFQGVRYRLGGEQPSSGFDCSGLVRYVFEQYHVEVPRTVAEQYQQGRHIAAADVQAGDLLFFTTIGPGATHVGIALGTAGPGEFVHAPGEGGVVRIEHFDSSYWRSRLVGVRRVF